MSVTRISQNFETILWDHFVAFDEKGNVAKKNTTHFELISQVRLVGYHLMKQTIQFLNFVVNYVLGSISLMHYTCLYSFLEFVNACRNDHTA
jgi:hypothetical protein